MPGLSRLTPRVYLCKHLGELAIVQGENPTPHQTLRKRVLIVGGGVTGLTVRVSHLTSLCAELIFLQTAWALLDAGYAVTVISDRWASPEDRITSQIAGALYVIDILAYDSTLKLISCVSADGSGRPLFVGDTRTCSPFSSRSAGA